MATSSSRTPSATTPSPAAPAPAPDTAAAALTGTAVVIKDFTSPFRRTLQTERMDDAFACIAMVVHKPISEVAEAAYRLGYPKHGPAITTDTLIAKLLMELGQLVASKYLDFHTWEALPDVAIVYVDYDEQMEIGRHILWHHVRASGKQNALTQSSGGWVELSMRSVKARAGALKGRALRTMIPTSRIAWGRR